MRVLVMYYKLAVQHSSKGEESEIPIVSLIPSYHGTLGWSMYTKEPISSVGSLLAFVVVPQSVIVTLPCPCRIAPSIVSVPTPTVSRP